MDLREESAWLVSPQPAALARAPLLALRAREKKLLAQQFERAVHDLERGSWPTEAFGARLELVEPVPIPEQALNFVRQGSDVVHFDRGSIFQEKVAVATLLTWNRVDNNHRGAASECFRSGQTARFGHHQVRDCHQLVDLIGEAENLGTVPPGHCHGCELLSGFLIPTGNHGDFER